MNSTHQPDDETNWVDRFRPLDRQFWRLGLVFGLLAIIGAMGVWYLSTPTVAMFIWSIFAGITVICISISRRFHDER